MNIDLSISLFQIYLFISSLMLCRKTVDVNAEIYVTNCDGFLSSQQETLTKNMIAGLVIATIVDIFVAVFITRGITKPINRIIAESITTPKKGGMMVTLKGSLKNLFTAEPQRAQSFWFFLLFADPRGIGFAFHMAGTPKSKTTQPFG